MAGFLAEQGFPTPRCARHDFASDSDRAASGQSVATAASLPVGSTGTRQQRVLCVGLEQPAVRGMAEFLARCGLFVTGILRTETTHLSRLQAAGIIVKRGPGKELAKELAAGMDLLIVADRSRATLPVSQHGAEVGSACGRSRVSSYAEVLAELCARRTGLVVTGGPGKSAVTAMLGWSLEQTMFDPTVIAGTEVLDWGSSCRLGGSRLLVAEVSDRDPSLQALEPSALVLLDSASADLDRDAQISDIAQRLGRLIAAVPADGLVLARWPSVRHELAKRYARARVESFGFDSRCDWWAADLRAEAGYYRFRIFYRGDYCEEVHLGVPGSHNVLNALAAYAVARWNGASGPELAEALASFQGCARQLELRGHWWGTAVLDDCASRPSQLAVAVGTVRQMYPRSRLWCAFQPPVKGTGLSAKWYVKALAEADSVLVTDPPQCYGHGAEAGEEGRRAAAAIATGLQQSGKPAKYVGLLSTAAAYLQSFLKPGDVLLVTGAGDVGKVADVFTRRISRYRQAG